MEVSIKTTRSNSGNTVTASYGYNLWGCVATVWNTPTLAGRMDPTDK